MLFLVCPGRIRQTIAENFDTFRDGTGPLYDYIAVDEAQQVDQLRQAVSDSTAAGGQSRVAPGAAVDDFVRPTDGRSSGLSSDLTTQRPPAYEDIDALDNVARNAPADLEDAAEPVYSDLRTFPRQNRQALPSDPSRRAPPLRFNSDDPSRFGGILRGQGDLQGKPIFHLTDVEIELVSEGLLDVIVTDVDTLQELPSNAFGLTNRPIASTAGQADSGLSFNFSPRGRGVASGTPQPLPPISPTPTPPTAGGATTPLPRPS